MLLWQQSAVLVGAGSAWLLSPDPGCTDAILDGGKDKSNARLSQKNTQDFNPSVTKTFRSRSGSWCEPFHDTTEFSDQLSVSLWSSEEVLSEAHVLQIITELMSLNMRGGGVIWTFALWGQRAAHPLLTAQAQDSFLLSSGSPYPPPLFPCWCTTWAVTLPTNKHQKYSKIPLKTWLLFSNCRV